MSRPISSLPTVARYYRALSPARSVRSCSGARSKVRSVCYMSTTATSPPRPEKADVKKGPETKSQSAPVKEQKGDSYVAGKDYFSYNPYSFYDIENDMQSDRLAQPTGQKMRLTFCLDKLNAPDEARRLLPEEFGYLVEWPGKSTIKRPNELEVPFVKVKGKYPVVHQPEDRNWERTRIPF